MTLVFRSRIGACSKRKEVGISIDAAVAAGEIEMLGQTVDGISVTRSYVSEGFEAADATLTLDLDVATGKIEVTR